MDNMDRELRTLLTQASGSPSLARRDELVDALVARADAVGADVAAAPSAPVSLEPVVTNVRVTSPARQAARLASLGLGGWIAIGAATAAAAAGVWLLEGAVFTDDPGPSITEPVTTVEVGAGPLEPTKVMVDPISAQDTESLMASVPQQDVPAARVEVLAAADGQAKGGDSAADGIGDGSGQAGGHPSSGDGSGNYEPGAPAGTESASGGQPGLLDPAVGQGLADGISDVEDALKDVVDDLLPEGPLADTVRPVIHAVDVGGLAHWLVGSLLCGQPAALAVTVTDDVGVVSVTVDVRTALGINASVPLSRGAGSTWTGILSPVVALDLGLLNTVIDVDITARDAAGNTATVSTSVRAKLLSC